ncbi:hypothetical protein [Streptococcus sp. NLN64]|uniref:hypothetical protein n=1 Tax=Streptococcus sp. NLN64 TaxID=2822799 RepID=UPI0018C9DE41|nr:hypothetical protein [Streptococcus sp. NLN64]MBG9367202.1 hypothetical protein [Streptococcus sp. NLN64]
MVIFTKSRLIEFALLFFVLLFGNVFHIIPKNFTIAFLTSADAYLLLFSVFIFVVYLGISDKKGKWQFGFSFLYLIVSLFVATYQSYNISGQSLILGIRAQREFLILLLSYFPLRKIVEYYEVDFENLLENLLRLGAFSTLFFMSQKLLYFATGSNFIDVAVNYSGTFSPYRMYVESSLIDLMMLIAVYRYMELGRFKYLLVYGLGLASQIWISQGRLELLSILAGSVLGVFLGGQVGLRKILVLFTLLFISVPVYFSSNFQSFFELLIGKSGGDTLTIRNIGRLLYDQQLNVNWSTFIFGTGYPNMQYEPSIYRTGLDKMIFLSDNGIYAFRYIYGTLALLVILYIVVKAFYLGWNVYRKKGNPIFLMYFLMISVMGQNIIFWYWHNDAMLLLLIMVVFLEYEIEKVRNEEELGY